MGSWKKRFWALCAGFLALFLISTVFCDPAYAAGIQFPVSPGDETGDMADKEPAANITTAPRAGECFTYWLNLPKKLIGPYDSKAMHSWFLIRGDDTVAAGGDIDTDLGGRVISTDHADGMALLYLQPGKTYEIEITNDPRGIYLEEYGLYADNRIMKQTVLVDAAKNVTVSNTRWVDSNGEIIGSQTGFVILDSKCFDAWTPAEIATAESLMKEMTLEEKVGQMFLLHYPGDGAATAQDANTYIDKYHPGGFLAFAKMFEGSNPGAVKAKVDANQAHSKIPLLFTVDEEGGKVTRISQYLAFYPKVFPYPQALVANGVDAVYEDATKKAALLTSLGFNVNHAPVADVSGPSGYMYQRTYGQDGAGNAVFVAAAVQGHEDNNVATTLKHFPGYGGTSSNTHNGFAVNDLSMDEFRHNDLIPFYAGIDAGSSCVMVTHNIVNAFDTENPASLSPKIMSYLRNTAGFDGVVMTDDLAMGAITQHVPAGQACLRAIQAGADMPMTATPEKDYPVVLAAVKSGSLPLSRIEESVRRILCWKVRTGIIDMIDFVDPGTAEASFQSPGSVKFYGSFYEMWNRGDGVVELLRDVTVGSLGLSGNRTLNLNGHTLTVNTGNIEIPSGVSFDIIDMTDMRLHSDGSISGEGRKAEVLDANTKYETGWHKDDQVLCYYIVDPDTGAKTKRAFSFSGLGYIVGMSGENFFTLKGGKLGLKGGVLTHPGRALYSYSGEALLDGGAILGCGAVNKPENGGSVYLQDGKMTFVSGYIGGSHARVRGGAVYATGENTEFCIEGPGVLACNTSNTQGGAIYATTLSHVSITGAAHVASNSSGSNGGAIYVLGANLSVGGGGLDSPFISDNQSGNGGGIFCYRNDSRVDLFSGHITGNRAQNGGGIAVGAGASSGKLSILADNETVTISYNEASANGGGIALHQALAAEIHNVAVHDNRAAGKGGGIWIDRTDVDLENARIEENVTGDAGGGLWQENASSKLSMNGTVVIAGNTKTGGEADNFLVPLNGIIKLEKQSLAGDSQVYLRLAAYPEGKEFLSVVSGDRKTVANSQHAFKLEAELSDYTLEMHEVNGELGIVTWAGKDQSVPVNNVLFQWYAPVRRLAVSGKEPRRTEPFPDVNRYLKVIDTSGRPEGDRLVKNGQTDIDLRYLFLEPDGTVLYTEKLTPLYESQDLSVTEIGNIESLWRFGSRDAGYDRGAVWVAESGERGLSTRPEDWTVYDYEPGIRFTTDKAQAGPKTIYIEKGYVVRFVGDVKTGENIIDATFFDYDITDGKLYRTWTDLLSDQNVLATDEVNSRLDAAQELFMRTNWNGGGVGINDIGNYSGGANAGNMFAFGNANTGVPWQNATFGAAVDGKASTMNSFNRTNFEGCTFGLVTGIDENGLPVSANGVYMPDLFSDNEITGKTVYRDMGLGLKRYGNTLTLSSVTGTDTKNLERFEHPGVYDGVSHKTIIWTNSFWPMDSKVSYNDGHDPRFGRTARGPAGKADSFRYQERWAPPVSDDDISHNSYFGMKLQLEFELEEDFIGPMAYTFFGDDDMWIFLDGELIVDIGGVHRSVGMYVDLWDYLDRHDVGTHKLDFFFTERGASGSTCWMNFCLPNIKTVDAPELGSLRLEKTVTGNTGEDDTDFFFEITLDLSDAEGEVVDGVFNYHGSKIGTLVSGDTISLGHGDYIVIEDIPKGTKYSIRELPALGYESVYPGNESGVVLTEDVTVSVVNKKLMASWMPETGGPGVWAFWRFGGMTLGLGAFGYLVRRRRNA